MIRRHLPLLLLICLLAVGIPAASAMEEMHYEQASHFTAQATESLTIASIRAANCEPGSSQHFTLDAYGQTYQLGVVSEKNLGWWGFNVSCEYPNGTIAYRDLSAFAPFAMDYDLTIQKYFLAADWIFDLDVNVALLPLTARFEGPEADLKGMDYGVLAFSEVIGSTAPGTFDITMYLVTPDEFKEFQKNSLLLKLGGAVQGLFDWAWDSIISFAGKIPYVGPFLETGLSVTGIVLEEIFFWLYLIFIEYPELVVLTVEFFIIADALLTTRSLMSLANRIIDNHIKVFEFVINTAITAIEVIMRVIQAIANAINALKPI